MGGRALHRVRGCSLGRWAGRWVDPSREPDGNLDPSPMSPWRVALERRGPRDHGVGMLQAPARPGATTFPVGDAQISIGIAEERERLQSFALKNALSL